MDSEYLWCKYKQRSILDVLRRLNLSYTRPTYTLEKKAVKSKIVCNFLGGFLSLGVAT